ncbi:hypothetical protein [Mycoplasma sp. P36-A1]|uniref:hypothetical protein n=1 Tax=Mycoplasma sp. P36-A1 TaxID=3252900 RepID=UPI003C2E11AB
MAKIVVGNYTELAQTRIALEKLIKEGFPKGSITLITNDVNAQELTKEGIKVDTDYHEDETFLDKLKNFFIGDAPYEGHEFIENTTDFYVYGEDLKKGHMLLVLDDFEFTDELREKAETFSIYKETKEKVDNEINSSRSYIKDEVSKTNKSVSQSVKEAKDDIKNIRKSSNDNIDDIAYERDVKLENIYENADQDASKVIDNANEDISNIVSEKHENISNIAKTTKEDIENKMDQSKEKVKESFDKTKENVEKVIDDINK